jgi:hypothetical protein
MSTYKKHKNITRGSERERARERAREREAHISAPRIQMREDREIILCGMPLTLSKEVAFMVSSVITSNRYIYPLLSQEISSLERERYTALLKLTPERERDGVREREMG